MGSTWDAAYLVGKHINQKFQEDVANYELKYKEALSDLYSDLSAGGEWTYFVEWCENFVYPMSEDGKYDFERPAKFPSYFLDVLDRFKEAFETENPDTQTEICHDISQYFLPRVYSCQNSDTFFDIVKSVISMSDNIDVGPTITSAVEDMKILSLLAEHRSFDPNALSSDGWTGLCGTVSCGHMEGVRFFLRSPGIDVNRLNADGQTALHVAAVAGRDKDWIDQYKEIARELLAAPGIDVDIRDKDGKRPVEHTGFESWGVLDGSSERANIS